MRRRLGFQSGKTPASSTFFEVLSVVPWEKVSEKLQEWLADADLLHLLTEASETDPGEPDALAIDGKTARGSWKRGAQIAHMLAVVSHKLAITLAQTAVARKQGELTGIRTLMEKLVLEGLVVTLDAQFTQRDVAETILEKGGDYVMKVKGNQPTLLREIEHLFSLEAYVEGSRRSTYTRNIGHGRIEERHLVALTVKAGELDWPGAAQAIMRITRRITDPTKLTAPVFEFAVTSLTEEEAGPERLERLIRGHWTVENKAFWVRDKVMGEDDSQVRTGNIVALLALLRGAVQSVIRAGGHKGAARTIRKFNANRGLALRALGVV
jgi:predicted transposase YbfD/YdcC